MTVLSRWSAACAAGVFSIACSFPAWADCDPKFGDQIYDWVSNTAGRQSVELTDADFEARTFNYFTLAYDDLNARTLSVREQLANAAQAISNVEMSLSEETIRQAIGRQQSATLSLNSLYKIRSDLDEISRRHSAMLKVPSLQQFQLMGLQNVGRASLLESLQELGDSAQKSLSARYSVYVGVQFDSDGKVTDASVNRKGDMADSVVMAGASYLPDPWSIVAVVVFQIGRFAIENESCERKVKEQKNKVREAYSLLPSRLITQDASYALYSKKYEARIAEFKDITARMSTTMVELDRSWKQLFAYNAARSQVANAILTASKIEQLNHEYSSRGDIDRIYNNVALARFATRISDLNEYVASHQARLLSSCSDVSGYLGVEDQIDALSYAKASLELFNNRAEFIPLQRLINKSHTAVDTAEVEVGLFQSRLNGVTCDRGASPAATAFDATRDLADISISSLIPRSEAKLTARFASTAAPDVSYCVLTKNGALYRCGSGNGGGRYGDGFDNSHGDPRNDVLVGGSDGGYASDNRRVGRDIEAVTSNVNLRIEDARRKLAEVKAAHDEWTSTNAAFLNNEQAAVEELRQTAESDLSELAAANAPALASAKALLDAFLQSPSETMRSSSLVRAVGGRELTLPHLSPDKIPVDIPALPGVSADDRAYPTSSQVDRRILRESRKLDALGARTDLEIAHQALGEAKKFAAAPGGEELFQALLRDSASVRFLVQGKTQKIEIAVMGDGGELSRVRIDPTDPLPENSLIMRARRFDDARIAFDSRAATLTDYLAGDQGSAPQRAALETAVSISDAARRSFYGGDVIVGAELMRLATVVLDVATSLTPGVSWGRDIYESVTGKNLISGEQLTTTERTLAVLGAVSGGIAGEGPKIFRAVQRIASLGEVGEKAEHIIQAARKIDHELDFTPHALERLNREEFILHNLGKDNVDAALDRGSRFWDIDQQTIVSFEEILQPGEWRAAAAVDPYNMKVTTVYAENLTDEALAQLASKTDPLITRFRKLAVDE